MSVETIRSALADACETIDGLQACAYVRDATNWPEAQVDRGEIDYDFVMADGPATYPFRVLVYGGRVDEIAAQALLDGYAEPTGATSVKVAIQSDTAKAAGAWDYADVKSCSAAQIALIGGVEYVFIEFTVEVVV